MTSSAARIHQTANDVEEALEVGHPVQNTDCDEHKIVVSQVLRQVIDVSLDQPRAQTGRGSETGSLSEKRRRLIDAERGTRTQRCQRQEFARVVAPYLHSAATRDTKRGQGRGQAIV